MFKASIERRTCRSFDPSKPVPRDILAKIAAAGANAPTGVDAQAFDVVVVTNAAALNTIAAASFEHVDPGLREKFKMPGPEVVFYGATAVVFIVEARKGAPNCVNYDLGIIAGSIALAAQDLGVQSAILGIVASCPVSVLQQTLGLSGGSVSIAVGLGYAAPGWTPPPRELVSPVKWLE
jgi:nitroreductase